MSNTQTNIAWYYVGVAVLLLFGQNYVLNTAHKDAMAKLTAKFAPVVAVAPAPVAAVASTATPAAAPTTVVAAPASTLSPAPAPAAAAVAPAPAKETAVVVAKSAPAVKAAPAATPIIASAAPVAGKTLPVALGFRSEPFKKGKIITLTNTSKNKLNCNVSVTRPATGESQSFKVAVAPAGEVRLAGNDNWIFKSGDQIEIAQNGYRPKTSSIP